MQSKFIISIVSTLMLFGCNVTKGTDNFAQGSNTTSGNTEDTNSEPTDEPDSGSPTDEPSSEVSQEPSTEEVSDEPASEPGSEEAGGFDSPGDVVISEDDDADSVVEVDLTDESGESNTDHEFYLIIVNAGEEEDLGYSLQYNIPSSEEETEEEEPPAEEGGSESESNRDDYRDQLEEARDNGLISTVMPPGLIPAPYTSSDIGIARKEYKVRDSLEDEETYERVETILWAVGDTVNIWVDESVYIDWDFECDGIIDQPAFNDAYGFDNCDLQTIASIVDINIVPTIEAIFGSPSDVNGDEKVSVVITPVLNQMTRGLDEEETDFEIEISLVGSYADPAVDLTDYDPNVNPMSDEEEVIFLHAPDPYGFHNPEALTPIAEYTNVTLGAQIARAFYRLVSYNEHVLVAEGEEEENWVTEGMAALAADMTGFGSTNYEGVWDYLDAPHLNSLSSIEESGAIATSSFGAQYLFFRWIADAYGQSTLQSLVQTGDIGTTNIETVLEEDMIDVVLKWQLAMLSKHSTSGTLGLEIDPGTYPPYAEVAFIQAPTSAPTSGQLYGANGYQQGIDIGSINYYMEGGTTNSPEENTNKRVVMGLTDHSTFAFGQDFFGSVAAGYGAQVVRLVDVPFTQSELEIRASAEGYSTAIVRAEDVTTDNYAKDLSYSPTEVNNILLPALPSDGSPIYALGDISDSGLTISVGLDGEEASADVYDTDRWLLSLSNYPTGAPVRMIAWLDYLYASQEGDIELMNPWLAVVPREYLPVPTVTGTQQGSCSDGYEFGYPYKMLDHLYYQLFLSNTAYNDTDLLDPAEETDEEGGSQSFDPCGSQSGATTTCDEDWDRDGVYDEDEPMPETLLSQIRVMQCTLAGNDVSGFSALNTDIIDVDESDEDDDATFDRLLNVGGISADGYEGAYIDIELEGGRDYIIVVGATEGTGAYELTLKKMIQ
ncbi:MAG: hypothetical protein VX278_20030 [Myxococcota bacterium]|nr:hypothetical protein [Myxococcota bacterium]